MTVKAVFTYRCWESPESAHAELWRHTGQVVTVLRAMVYPEVDEDDIGGPMFRIRFADGYEHDAFNDEIEEIEEVTA